MGLLLRLFRYLKQPACVAVLSLVFFSHLATADELTTLQKISPAEAQALRAVIQQPQPAGLTTQSLNQWYQNQDAAAFKLGDPNERERILRAWFAASPNIDSKWSLGNFLISNSKNSADGFNLLHQVLEEQRHPVHMVRIRSHLAWDYLEEHQLKKAKTLLEEAGVIISKEFGRYRTSNIGYWSVRAEMEYHRTMARLLMRQGHFDASAAEASKAQIKGSELKKWESFVAERQVQRGRMWHANSALEVAVSNIAAGKIYEAEESLREALTIFKGYQFTEEQTAHVYRWISDLYFAQGRYNDALRLAQKVRDIQQNLGLADGTAQAIFTRSRINKNLVAQKKWQEALKEFDSIDQTVGDNDRLKPIARMVDLRGLTLLNNGRVDDAVNMFRGTLNYATTNFGEEHYFTAFKRGLYGMALAKDPARQDLALTELAQATRNLSAPDSLSNQFEESPFRLALRQDIYKTYIRLLAQNQATQPNAAALAFAASNHLMVSSVQQAISDAAARAAIKKPGLGQVARLDQDAKTELSTLYGYITAQAGESQQQKLNPEVVKAMRQRVGEIETLRRGYKTHIQKEYPEYFQLLQPKAPSPSDIAKLLGNQEVLVSIVPMDDETYVFAIDKSGQTRLHRSAINQKQIAEAVKALRSTLDVADRGMKAPRFNFEKSHLLYQQLLSPIEAMLSGKEHLIVATSGALGQLPFAVLVKQPWAKNDHAQAPWLIRDIGISHVSSSSAWVALKELAKTPSGNKPMMAWGDPSFAVNANSSSGKTSVRAMLNQHAAYADIEKNSVNQLQYASLPPLPETRDEVLSLAKLLNADLKTDVFLGEQATRESVIKASDDAKLYDQQIVVFATHGLLPGDLPKLEQPALAMSAVTDPNSSPLLTLEDVMGLRLNADWVVLSACNTAGADGKVEEALSGLARGFFYAGSRSLLVTHWSVESESAMRLTTRTFEAYKKQPQISRAQALRQSMLHLMQTPAYAHPTFWAPYALVGEGAR
jgi:CHAT domain-containing protein/Tfp pilus assembly protein PilF